MLCIPIGDLNKTRKKPYINYSLIAVNIAVFIIGFFFTNFDKIIYRFGFIPAKPELFQVFTSLFLHGSFMHLFMNMLFLWIAGDNVEDSFGHFGYLLFYLGAGLMGNIFHYYSVTAPHANIPCIGASGAISGVLGAYVLVYPRKKIVFWWLFWFILPHTGTFALASVWVIGAWFIMQLLSHIVSQGAGYSEVAYAAHIGGFISGAVITGLLVIMGRIKAKW